MVKKQKPIAPAHPDDIALVGAAEQLAQSARAVCERRFTAEGARAPKDATNPYRPGCAAATWWQRGREATKLTPAMLRELRAIERGQLGDLLDYGYSALAFHARDRVIGALERRGLIIANPDWSLTDAGRAALAEQEVQS